ncbi:MAG: phosphoenolpyruvate carboxylase [Vicinamibacterales bacterium]
MGNQGDEVDADRDRPLRDDVRLLGELLGRVIRRREGEAVFQTVERVRHLAKSARAGNQHDFDALRRRVLANLPTNAALPIARAFAKFLTLAGALRSLSIDLVLTAHPTEVFRRTLLQKHNRIGALLDLRDRPDLTSAEQEDVILALEREIAAIWETDEVRRERPSPLDEVRWGLAVVEGTLWDAVPRYLRALDRAAAVWVDGGLGRRRFPFDSARGWVAIATATRTSRRR